jgi:hypothetical protein
MCAFVVVVKQSSILSEQGMCMSDLVQYIEDDFHSLPKWECQNMIRFNRKAYLKQSELCCYAFVEMIFSVAA